MHKDPRTKQSESQCLRYLPATAPPRRRGSQDKSASSHHSPLRDRHLPMTAENSLINCHNASPPNPLIDPRLNLCHNPPILLYQQSHHHRQPSRCRALSTLPILDCSLRGIHSRRQLRLATTQHRPCSFQLFCRHSLHFGTVSVPITPYSLSETSATDPPCPATPQMVIAQDKTN